MKKLMLLLVVMITLGNSTFAQTKNFIDQAYFETSVQVDSLVIPDRIYLSIHLKEEDSRGKISVEEQENKMARVLRELGINLANQLRLADLSSDQERYILRKKDVYKEKLFYLLVYDANTAGQVIQKLEAVKISNIALQKTAYSKLKELQLHLRVKAVEEAKVKAASMLAPLDQKPGKILYLADSSPQPYAAYNDLLAIQTGAANYSRQEVYEPIAIEFSKLRVSATVQVKFAID
jgi:uncharacterized protein YggE